MVINTYENFFYKNITKFRVHRMCTEQLLVLRHHGDGGKNTNTGIR